MASHHLKEILSLIVLVLLSVLGINAQEKIANGLQTYSETIPGTEVSFEMVVIPKGSFDINDTAVIYVDSFWMGIHEVTYDAFIHFQRRDRDNDSTRKKGYDFDADAVARPTPPYEDMAFGMGKRGGYPMVSVTQQAALRYCKWLYEKTGNFYRLPTEAEWTHACLAGQQNNAEGLDAIAWYFDNSDDAIHVVGTKKPNAFGIYDMIGNVAEWTLDQYAQDWPASQYQNPWTRPTKKHSRTVKGGAYDDDANACQCEFRLKSKRKWQERDPQIPKSLWWNTDAAFVGFRIVRPAKMPSEAEIEQFWKDAIID